MSRVVLFFGSCYSEDSGANKSTSWKRWRADMLSFSTKKETYLETSPYLKVQYSRIGNLLNSELVSSVSGVASNLDWELRVPREC